MLIDLIVKGKPVSNNTKLWVNPATKKPIAYKPKKAKEYKELIKFKLNEHMRLKNIECTCMPVILVLMIYFQVPTSYSKKKKESLIDMPCPKKPDIDNIQKLVVDAISKDAWNKSNYLLENDSQICEVHSYKKYSYESYIRIIVHKYSEY